MKTVILSVLITCISVNAFAQKGKVISAYEFLRAGDITSAKTAIDEAAAHEKTINDPKTWFYYGNTYNAIARSESNKIKMLDVDAGEKSIKAYFKALQLDEKGKFKKKIDTELSILKALMVNQAIEAYNKKGFKHAFSKFETATTIAEKMGETDTIALYYGAVAANQAGLTEKSTSFYNKCIQVNCCGPDVYVALASMYRTQNDEKLKTTVNQGLAKYPDNNALILEQLNIQLGEKQFEQAITTIDKAISQAPNDEKLHFAKGLALENIGNEFAEDSYKKALQIAPDYFEANFNLGALYNNLGDNYIEKANNLNYKTEGDEIKDLKQKADTEYSKALPYLEKTYELKPYDADVKTSLRILYTKLNMLDKAKTLKE